MCSWIGRYWSSTDSASSGLDSGHNCTINPNEYCWLFKQAGQLRGGGENEVCSRKVVRDVNRNAIGSRFSFQQIEWVTAKTQWTFFCSWAAQDWGDAYYRGDTRWVVSCWRGSVCCGPIDTILFSATLNCQVCVQIQRRWVLLSFLLVFFRFCSFSLLRPIKETSGGEKSSTYVANGADTRIRRGKPCPGPALH